MAELQPSHARCVTLTSDPAAGGFSSPPCCPSSFYFCSEGPSLAPGAGWGFAWDWLYPWTTTGGFCRAGNPCPGSCWFWWLTWLWYEADLDFVLLLWDGSCCSWVRPPPAAAVALQAAFGQLGPRGGTAPSKATYHSVLPLGFQGQWWQMGFPAPCCSHTLMLVCRLQGWICSAKCSSAKLYLHLLEENTCLHGLLFLYCSPSPAVSLRKFWGGVLSCTIRGPWRPEGIELEALHRGGVGVLGLCEPHVSQREIKWWSSYLF